MPHKDMITDGPHPVDIHVGRRVRLRRTLLGLSQETLGACLDLSFQQVQKYEKGRNRVSASRLHQLGDVLDVPVSYFFDDMPGEGAASPSDDLLARRETLELVRAYYGVGDPAVRRRLYDLVRALGRAAARRAA